MNTHENTGLPPHLEAEAADFKRKSDAREAEMRERTAHAPRALTAQEKLEMAAALVDEMKAQCADLGAYEDPEVLVMAVYAMTERATRRELFFPVCQ